ncbi:MAG: GNAT family N-acetyltransferase [Terracoccus sp.]
MSWRIEELELAVDDPASERWLEVHLAANRAVWGAGAERTTVAEVLDAPARRHEVRRAFGLWVDDGQGPDGLVAAAQTIRSTRDNLDTAGLWLSVHPSHQRRGLGSALLSHCEASLRADGCTRIHEHSGAPVESGDAATGFAIARAYRQTLVDLRQDLALPVGEDELDRLAPDLDRAAYVLETAVGGLPEEWLEDRALLARRMSTDAPSGDVDLDEEDWDAERVARVWNTPGEVRSIESVARHVPSGRLVGFTDLAVRPGSPDLAVQGDTLVLREHRGNALGLALKVANLRALAREQPGVTSVRTWNAETNAPMLAVNDRLGFTVTGWTREWVKDL